MFENPVDRIKLRRVMRRANELRRSGLTKKKALRQAWSEIGEVIYPLDYVSGFMDKLGPALPWIGGLAIGSIVLFVFLSKKKTTPTAPPPAPPPAIVTEPSGTPSA